MRPSSFSIHLVFVCLAGALSTPARAQQPVFTDEVTVTATGTETSTDEIPLPATVISRDEIDDAQQESVAEMLRRSPGVTIVRAGGEGSATSVFTRGTESDHTLALFDGVRLNSPYFGGYDWSMLTTAGVERIEIVRGPFSALWGADAIGGVINVVPTRAGDGLSANLLGEVGEEGWQRLDAAFGYSAEGLDVYASAFDREGRGVLDNSDFSARQLLVDAGWSWAEGSRVAVLVQALDSELGIPFSSPGSLTPDRRQGSDQRLVAIPLKLRLDATWRMELVASYLERDFAFSDPEDPFGFTRSDTSADTVMARLASHHRVDDHRLSWGAEWRRDEVSDSSRFGTNLDGQRSAVASAFVQDRWQPMDGVSVIAGVRWDDADEWGSEVSPRLALGFEVASGVELRAAYGRAFRQPSVGELYFPFSGNPELEAERSESAEVGLACSLGSSRLQLNFFSTEIDSLIDFDYATYAFANTAEASIRGAEGSWEQALAGRIVSSLQATWLDTEDAAGLALLRRPEWSASGTLRGAIGRRWRGDLSLLWVGARNDVDANTFQRIELDGHLTGNLAVGFEVAEGFEITLRIHNLGDRNYQEVAGYPAPGRRFSGGIRWRL